MNKERPMDDPVNEPEDVRKAVQQLSLAFRRGQKVLEAQVGPIDAGQRPGKTDASGKDEAPEVGAPVVSREDVEAASDALRRAEAVLFAAGAPLSAEQIAECLPPGADASAVLMELRKAYANRGVNLIEVDGRWRFQTAGDLGFLFVEERHEQKKLSQAALETLAIIAYAQPVTRAEIEDVRGVAVSKDTVDKLFEAGWVKIKGRRKSPGRPVTYGTTGAFLEHFGIESLDMLPGKAELAAEGLLSSVIPEAFEADELPEGVERLETAPRETGPVEDDTAFSVDFMGEAEDD
jgi:segregation and condensation protein B